MRSIFQMRDAVYYVIDSVWLDGNCGYALAETKHEYAVYWFDTPNNRTANFTDGQHFMKNNDDHKARKEARINMWTRASETLREWADMDRLDLMTNGEREQDNLDFYYNHPEGVTLDEK